MKVIILRGIPGSGKSTYQRTHWPKAIVCSADDYFLQEGERYVFNPARLGAAHNTCLRKFLRLTSHPIRHDVVVVDNTNIQLFEIAPYYAVANALWHEVEVHTLICDPKIAASRNVHQVPLKTIRQLALDLRRVQLPSHWHKFVIT